jgi:hypothetical protein
MAALISSPSSMMANTSVGYSNAISSSKTFYVRNIDDRGRIIHFGYLEISEEGLTFSYEHYQTTIHWPFNCIRRYGANSEGTVFVIEAGRSSPDGEGLYAFKTENGQACAEMRQRMDYFTQHTS